VGVGSRIAEGAMIGGNLLFFGFLLSRGLWAARSRSLQPVYLQQKDTSEDMYLSIYRFGQDVTYRRASADCKSIVESSQTQSASTANTLGQLPLLSRPHPRWRRQMVQDESITQLGRVAFTNFQVIPSQTLPTPSQQHMSTSQRPILEEDKVDCIIG